ncbi:MAG: glycosyltransferase [Flavisolibacter sp.]
MNERLHIVCLDAPSPPDYGGAIDMFYTIRALASIGKKPVLHYFNYRKERGVEGLEHDCEEIFSYPRKSFSASMPFSKPYIIGSRTNDELVQRLNAEKGQILLEGLHCTGIVSAIKDQTRISLRLHNEEAEYYRRLSITERSLLKKIYLKRESRLLKKWYRQLPSSLSISCLSQSDEELIQQNYGLNNTRFIPCFIPWQKIRSTTGRGSYCLYHGNMSVSENQAAAAWLITQVFSKLQVPFVIAGNSVSKYLYELSKPHPHIRLVNHPSMEEIDQLVQQAQVHVLPSFNSTGVKLKLLHALAEGRFCLANAAGAKGSAVENLTVIADSAEGFIEKIKELWQRDFSEAEIKNRQNLLTVYDNAANAKMISER